MTGFVGKYASLAELERDCDYIVKGTKVGSSFVGTGKDGVYRLTASYRIDEIIVDYFGIDIPETVNVTEGIKYDSNRDVTTHMYGYEQMKVGNQYVLFLKAESLSQYRITGTIYGKIPVNEGETTFISDEEYANDERVIRIRNIINDARSEYVLKGSNTELEEPQEPEVEDPENTVVPHEPEEEVPDNPEGTIEPEPQEPDAAEAEPGHQDNEQI